MSAAMKLAAPLEVGTRSPRFAVSSGRALWPLLLAVLNSTAFLIVRPNVGDLQAALARQSAASNGVGLTYWFQWFGGGATPGNYSVLSPYLSSLLGAPLVGALASVAITPLAHRALAATRYRVLGTWVATLLAALNIWSGRIPFALGLALGVIVVIGVLERRVVLALICAVISTLSSPVTGVFLAFGLAAAFVIEREYRRSIFAVCATSGVTLLVVALVFGSPGPQGYSVTSSLIVSGTALAMLFAKPVPSLQAVLWCTAVLSPLLTLFANGLGSNFVRFPWICLPAAVIATASSRRLVAIIAILPAVVSGANATLVDLERSQRPAANASYYDSLIKQLDSVDGLANYRLEVVQNDFIHTAAYALLGHVALAGGYETQEQNALNSVLNSPTRLDAISYKVWLDNNAVGYVAFNKQSRARSAEYQLVAEAKLSYLTRVSSNAKWTLFRVQYPSPIVPSPERLVTATQATLTISVPCACSFDVRVRYSKFLGATQRSGAHVAEISDDGTGWTLVTTPAPGTYVLHG